MAAMPICVRNDVGLKSFDCMCVWLFSLLVHGKHFDLSMGVGSLGLSHPEGAAPLEEILEENGTIEEILAIDYKTRLVSL